MKPDIGWALTSSGARPAICSFQAPSTLTLGLLSLMML